MFLKSCVLCVLCGISFASSAEVANESKPQKLDEQQLMEAAKNAVAHDLKDPGSVLFRDVIVRYRNNDSAICGEYNAKNSYGAYVGFQKFFVSGSSSFTEGEMSAAREQFLQLWHHMCD